MMGHWHGGWSGGEWALMGVGMLLFWTLVVAAIVWAVRYAGGDRRSVRPVGMEPTTERSRAREILDERYARGEIGDDEYRTRRDTLGPR